jgi:hypothetical protein
VPQELVTFHACLGRHVTEGAATEQHLRDGGLDLDWGRCTVPGDRRALGCERGG